MMIPIETYGEHLTGSDFESLVYKRCDQLKERRLACIGKYGVKVRFDDSVNAYRPIRSLPDFEGVFGRHATQAIFDCKVESSASMDLNKYRVDERGPKSLQLRHMYDRSAFGAICFFLIHFNARETITKTFEAMTFAMPVHEDHPFWRRFEQREEKRLSPATCKEYAVPVIWNRYPKDHTFRPDIMEAITVLAEGNDRTALVPRSIKSVAR